jgi:hypothetical protein
MNCSSHLKMFIVNIENLGQENQTRNQTKKNSNNYNIENDEDFLFIYICVTLGSNCFM